MGRDGMRWDGEARRRGGPGEGKCWRTTDETRVPSRRHLVASPMKHRLPALCVNGREMQERARHALDLSLFCGVGAVKGSMG
jgi:hypothetical protein